MRAVTQRAPGSQVACLVDHRGTSGAPSPGRLWALPVNQSTESGGSCVVDALASSSENITPLF